MKHLRHISRRRPAKAQFESFLQLVGLLSSILMLYNQIVDTFDLKPE